MAELFRRGMDYLYLACVVVGCTALVLISAIIPWAVFTRYVLNSAASWPEPLAILLTIVLTFIGAAACYRRGLHMNVGFFADMLPSAPRRVVDFVVEGLMAVMAIFMVHWGIKLVDATWDNTIADFPFLSVGVTYLRLLSRDAATSHKFAGRIRAVYLEAILRGVALGQTKIVQDRSYSKKFSVRRHLSDF